MESRGYVYFVRLAFIPFGKKVEIHPFSHLVANILWAVLFGWELATVYFVGGVACCATVVGIPAGLVSFKMMKLAFLPFGAIVRKKK